MKKRILIVDDSRIVLSLHSFIVKNAGFEAVTAENGFEALEKLMMEQFDLILTDLNMPKMDGYELVRKIRELSNYSSVPIVMISTEQEEHDQTKGYEAGANLYLVKPTQPDVLVQNIKMLLPSAG